MKRVNIFYMVLVLLFAAGCSLSPQKSSNANLPSLDGDWSVVFSYSGGIAGLSRQIQISSDGQFTAMDVYGNKTVTGTLTSNQQADLKELVAASEYIPPTEPQGGCADCFYYDLSIQGSKDNFSAQTDDINVSDSGLAPLVNYLRIFLDDHLK
jgi:hypothetical protein